jgi:hypothetical protein
MIVLQIKVILCIFVLLCGSSSFESVVIDLNPTITATATSILDSYTISRNTKQIFCYQSKHQLLSSYHLYHIFHEISILVSESNGEIFSWHAINGVSTDDFHTNLNSFIHYLIDKNAAINRSTDDISNGDNGSSSDGNDVIDVEREPYEQESFIRDILSACPSPLFTSHRSQCHMKFSSVGKSCITIKAHNDYDNTVSISIMHHFNSNLVYNLIAGLVLITFAGLLAKSKVFQVTFIFDCSDQ